MKIPKKIKIGGFVYRVVPVDPVYLRNGADGAHINVSNLTIAISNEIKGDGVIAYLLHEILHGINIEKGEEEIEFLTQALCQVFLDNPELVKLFLRRKK